MKGNIMIRMISLMIIVPVLLAHFAGQIDLLQPTWLWLTLFAGVNALQATFTGWCPVSRFLPKDPETGACCVSDTTGTCCAGEVKDAKDAGNNCCDDKDKTKESGCCDSQKDKSACCSEPKSTPCFGDSSIEIKVLGTGCANCDNTMKLIESVASEEGVSVTVIKVDDVAEIASYGVMSTPGVVIAEKVVHAGGIPTRQAVEGWLK